MSDKELAQGSIGPEANYDIAFKGGKLVLALNYQGKQAGAGVNVTVGVGELLDKLKETIPGHFDDAVIDAAKVLLGA
jgi:hypothetical protein